MKTQSRLKKLFGINKLSRNKNSDNIQLKAVFEAANEYESSSLHLSKPAKKKPTTIVESDAQAPTACLDNVNEHRPGVHPDTETDTDDEEKIEEAEDTIDIKNLRSFMRKEGSELSGGSLKKKMNSSFHSISVTSLHSVPSLLSIDEHESLGIDKSNHSFKTLNSSTSSSYYTRPSIGNIFPQSPLNNFSIQQDNCAGKSKEILSPAVIRLTVSKPDKQQLRWETVPKLTLRQTNSLEESLKLSTNPPCEKFQRRLSLDSTPTLAARQLSFNNGSQDRRGRHSSGDLDHAPSFVQRKPSIDTFKKSHIDHAPSVAIRKPSIDHDAPKSQDFQRIKMRGSRASIRNNPSLNPESKVVDYAPSSIRRQLSDNDTAPQSNARTRRGSLDSAPTAVRRQPSDNDLGHRRGRSGSLDSVPAEVRRQLSINSAAPMSPGDQREDAATESRNFFIPEESIDPSSTSLSFYTNSNGSINTLATWASNDDPLLTI